MMGTFIAPKIVPRWVENRVVLITFLFILGTSTLLVGPLSGDLNLTMMVVGLVLTGIAIGPLAVPNMAEMMDGTVLEYPDCDLDHANSLLSSMLNACFGLGQTIGPILGASLYESTNFRCMTNIIGSLIIFMAFLYLICAGGC